MFLTHHPQFAADVFRYDPTHPDARDATAAIAAEYAHHELARLCADDNASSSTALALLDTLDGSAAVNVCRELEDVVAYFTWEWGGWEATFAPDAVDSALRSRLIEPDQVALCETWLTRLQQGGLGLRRGRYPFLAHTTIADARVLLALNVMALRAMGDHATELQRGVQDSAAENIQGIERVLSVFPLPGLPRLPFPDEETARLAADNFGL